MNYEDYGISGNVKAAVVSIISENFEHHRSEKETRQSLDELKELLRTLGLDCEFEAIQQKDKPHAGTVLGRGKLEEIALQAKEVGVELLVFDFELSGSQQRNIKRLTGIDVCDRISIILEIFAKHAKTKEAKIQIEIVRLQYLLPRLTALWTHFTKQRGGTYMRGGEGEQQIELDRRMIRKRIASYQKQLIEIKKRRKEQRKRRQNNVITAALVGYTNAGKSSILNRLCREDILEENKLFATLDSTYRTLNPDTKPPMVLIDTVGFISNLPSSLVSGFKTTLESALEADLLVVVADVSDENVEKHLEVTKEVLEELGIEKKDQIFVFNKSDKLESDIKAKILLKEYKNSFLVSTQDKDDMARLRTYIINHFLEMQPHYDLFVPYGDGHTHAKIAGNTNVLKMEHRESGTFYRVRIPDFLFHNLRLERYRLAPHG